jgi:hypothetical protein
MKLAQISNIICSCTVFFGLMGASSTAFAGSSNEFFKNLSGCFNVSFEYKEEGRAPVLIDGLFEWIAPLQADPETSLQHIGLTEGQAFKHWREEWKENSDGTWSQKVIGPFGDFRYECSAPLENNKWRCAVKGAPKPRRDKDRRDYLKLDRDNTLEVTPEGWVQTEENVKRDADGKAVSNEMGWNRYERVDNSHCAVAIEFMKRMNGGHE